MKAALNGALNCSILDGWWDECYDGANGWAIESADDDPDLERRDLREAGSLFAILENQVVPQFYDRGRDGVPRQWVRDGAAGVGVARPAGHRGADGPRLHDGAVRAGGGVGASTSPADGGKRGRRAGGLAAAGRRRRGTTVAVTSVDVDDSDAAGRRDAAP